MSDEGLSIRDLRAGYSRREVITGLTVSPLKRGSMTALVGPNAAGKTTLLRSLAGLVRAQGSVMLDGRELIGLSAAEHARYVTYMPQTLPQRVALTVHEAMLAALHASGGMAPAEARSRSLETLEMLGILPLAMRGLDELSGGQRQLASLAQAIVRNPRVLLLDEPTSALDLAHQHRVMRTVDTLTRARGMVTVAVVHDIALACRWCERIVVLAEGGLAADGLAAEAVTPEMLARVYCVSARVERCSQGTLQVIIDDVL